MIGINQKFFKTLIECTPKAAFQALYSVKHSRPFPSDLNTDYKQGKLLKVIFNNTHNSLSSSFLFRLSRESTNIDISTTNVQYEVFLKYSYPGLCGIKICAL